MDKNNDLLYRDLKETMSESKNEIVQQVFPKSELTGYNIYIKSCAAQVCESKHLNINCSSILNVIRPQWIVDCICCNHIQRKAESVFEYEP